MKPILPLSRMLIEFVLIKVPSFTKACLLLMLLGSSFSLNAQGFSDQLKGLEDSLQISKNGKHTALQVELLFKIGKLCLDSTHYIESLKYLRQVEAIPNADVKTPAKVWSKFCYQMGLALRFNSKLDAASQWLLKALATAKKNQDEPFVMLIYATLLEFQVAMNETKIAQGTAHHYIQSAYHVKDSLHIAYAYHVLADLLIEHQQYADAKKACDKACSIAKKAKQFAILSYMYCDYSHIYEGLDQLDKASYFARKSIQNAQRYYPILATFSMINLAKVDYRRGLYEASVQKLLQVKADMYKAGNTIAILKSMHLLVQCYQAQKKIPEAIATAQELIAIADQTFNERMSDAGKRLLPDLYAISGQYQKAYLLVQAQLQEQGQKLKASNQLSNKLELLQEQERNKLIQLQQELKVKTAQSQAQRNFLGMAIVFVLGVVVFLLLRNRLLREKAKGLQLKDEAHKKQEELRAFNYSLGHDLMAPVDNAQMFLARFEEKFTTIGEEGREYLQKLRLILEDTKAMIAGMLNYAQQDELPLFESNIDCKKEVENLAKTLQEIELDRKIEFEIGELPVLYGDKLMLRQVFSNLLSNAVKFTRLQNVAKIKIFARQQIGNWEIVVQDNGTGVSEQGKERVFQLFKTEHDRTQFPGVGVGLSIVKRVIERHNGQVWVSNNPDGGAIFGIVIPSRSVLL